MSIGGSAQYAKKTNVAHRGASAYAPEHTLAAYRLAIEMGADYVEQDLAVTKDGVLICLHDASLERTTNVEEVFPDRGVSISLEGKTRKAWVANDFTLAEIKQLDAGSWFNAKFKGEKVPTFDEAIALIKGKAGIFPELKTPEIYEGRKIDFEQLVAAALDKHGLRGAEGGSEDAGHPADLRPGQRARAGAHQDWRAGGVAAQRRRRLQDRSAADGLEGRGDRFRPDQEHRAAQPGFREVGTRRRHDGDAVYVPIVGRGRRPASRMSPKRWRTISTR